MTSDWLGGMLQKLEWSQSPLWPSRWASAGLIAAAKGEWSSSLYYLRVLSAHAGLAYRRAEGQQLCVAADSHQSVVDLVMRTERLHEPLVPARLLVAPTGNRRAEPLGRRRVARVREHGCALEQRRPKSIPGSQSKDPGRIVTHAAFSAASACCSLSRSRTMARVCTCETRDSEIPSARPISLSVRCS